MTNHRRAAEDLLMKLDGRVGVITDGERYQGDCARALAHAVLASLGDGEDTPQPDRNPDPVRVDERGRGIGPTEHKGVGHE